MSDTTLIVDSHVYNVTGVNGDTIPIDTIGNYEDYKLGFIADYRMKRYRLFEDK